MTADHAGAAGGGFLKFHFYLVAIPENTVGSYMLLLIGSVYIVTCLATAFLFIDMKIMQIHLSVSKSSFNAIRFKIHLHVMAVKTEPVFIRVKFPGKFIFKTCNQQCLKIAAVGPMALFAVSLVDRTMFFLA